MTALLDVREVTKRFGSLTAVDGVSFRLEEGEILALIGPNGAGKTTTMDVIAGSGGRWSGEVTFAGRALRRLKPHQIGRLGISRTFQVARPFAAMTLLENVTVGALFGRDGSASVGAARRRALETLHALGLGEQARDPAQSLNASERKRLEIARALAMEPRLLLLDEVMAGLNAVEVDETIGLIDGLRGRGISILLVEHVMRAVTSLADRVVVLDHGEKVADGAPAEVLSRDAVVGAYLGRRGTRRGGPG